MKFRVKEYISKATGRTYYRPQYKKFLLWKNWYDNSILAMMQNLLGGPRIIVSFTSRKDALEWIESSRQWIQDRKHHEMDSARELY